MTLRLTWKRVIVTLAGLVLAGLLFAWSGLMQISASSGHWAVTDWFLHWTMQNSARTYSTFQTPAKVRDDTALVSAAGHFRQACQVCHGAPGHRPSPVMQSATPPAPDLAKVAGHYTDRELFWIVKHGVKFTGMPAWPTPERPDEIRRMVGFLRALPAMSPQRYEELTAPRPSGVPESAPALARSLAACTGCHGSDGMGRGQSDIPVIAGQKADHLYRTLRAYAAGSRQSGAMQVAAAALDEAQMRALADHFAALPGLHDVPLAATHPLLVEGDRRKQLPACASCHAPGRKAPYIAGQHAAYLTGRLKAWQGEETTIDAHKPQVPMPVIARRIPADQIAPLARALSQQQTAPKREPH